MNKSASGEGNGLRHSRTASLKQAKDQAEQADKVKSSFLATMSHELRPPEAGAVVAALDIEAGLPLGLIVCELVGNALEYAFVGRSRGSARASASESPGL